MTSTILSDLWRTGRVASRRVLEKITTSAGEVEVTMEWFSDVSYAKIITDDPNDVM